MATPPLTPRQVAEAERAVKDAGGNVSLAARNLGLPVNTLSNRLKAIKRYQTQGTAPEKVATKDDVLAIAVKAFKEHGVLSELRYRRLVEHPIAYRSRWPTWAAFKADVMKAAGLKEDPRITLREEDQRRRTREELRRAHRQLNEVEDYRKAVFGLAEQPIAPPEWILRPPKGNKTPGAPLLFASDFQWGEVISAHELDGINAFNPGVAARRYKALIEKTLELSFVHEPNPVYPGVIYARGGDMVSGDIHEELRETNAGGSIPQVTDLVAHETAGIKKLLEAFKRVHVVSVPGNHGRQTHKPTHKRAVLHNYDTLSAWMLEREFRGDKRVTWQTPVSGDALLDVYGWQLCITHGDRIGSSGGQGFVGPSATVARGMQKVLQYYAAMGKRIDLQLIGHFHVPMMFPWGYSNGCLPGYSEYARSLRATPGPPSQWLLFIHPQYRVSHAWQVYLEKQRVTPSNVHLPWIAEAA